MQGDTSNGLEQLWGEGPVRAFLSHNSTYKREVSQVQAFLKGYGIASFVSHEDIKPMREWQAEIIRALRSADVLIAFLTDDFRRSKWTDQEVGIAIGREIPVIPIRLGRDPHGFMGKYQALTGSFTSTPRRNPTAKMARDIFDIVLREESISDIAKDAYVLAVSQASNFDRANSLAKLLPQFDSITPEQARGLMTAFNENDQVFNSYGFRDVLIDELTRLTGCDFMMLTDKDGEERLTSVDLLFSPLLKAGG